MQIKIDNTLCKRLYELGFHQEYVEHFARPLENTTDKSRNVWTYTNQTYHVVGDCALVPAESVSVV